jgi:hypothetical protein
MVRPAQADRVKSDKRLPEKILAKTSCPVTNLPRVDGIRVISGFINAYSSSDNNR